MAVHTVSGYTPDVNGRAYLLQVDNTRWTMKRVRVAWRAGDTLVTAAALGIRFVTPNAIQPHTFWLATSDVTSPTADTLTGVPQVNLVQASAV